MSNLQIYYAFKQNFENSEQHIWGKWLIHGTKHHKDTQLQCLELPCRICHLGGVVAGRVRCVLSQTCFLGCMVLCLFTTNKNLWKDIYTYSTHTYKYKIQQNAFEHIAQRNFALHIRPFLPSFYQSFIEHIAPLIHHTCITHSSNCISTHHSMHHKMHQTIKYHRHQITVTNDPWHFITIMHLTDDASQQCITILINYCHVSNQDVHNFR